VANMKGIQQCLQKLWVNSIFEKNDELARFLTTSYKKILGTS